MKNFFLIIFFSISIGSQYHLSLYGAGDKVAVSNPSKISLGWSYLFSSNDFLSDQSLQMVGSSDGTLYMNSPQMIVNFVDWALEDESLTSIRARGNFNRTLQMSNETSQRIFEYVNYVLAILSVLVVAWLYRLWRARECSIQENWLAGEGEVA